MSPELTAAIIGALIGAAAAYLFGWRMKALDDARKRKSIASALLAETYPLANAMDTLRGQWPGYRIAVELPTVVLDAIPGAAELFDAPTVAAALDLVGSVRDVKTGLDTLNSANPADPDGIKQIVRTIAASCLGKIVIVRDAAAREGGSVRNPAPWPSKDRIDELLTETRERLKDTARLKK